MGSRLYKRICSINPEEVDEHNSGLGVLVRFVKKALEARE